MNLVLDFVSDSVTKSRMLQKCFNPLQTKLHRMKLDSTFENFKFNMNHDIFLQVK